jgi:hypothetical protein
MNHVSVCGSNILTQKSQTLGSHLLQPASTCCEPEILHPYGIFSIDTHELSLQPHEFWRLQVVQHLASEIWRLSLAWTTEALALLKYLSLSSQIDR